MAREDAIATLRKIAGEQHTIGVESISKLIRLAYQHAAMLRDEGMSIRVENAVAVLVGEREADSPIEQRLDAIAQFAADRGGNYSLHFNACETRTGRWSGVLTWGREALDSPMAGAQALGIGEDPIEVLDQIIKEAHVEVPDA